jgi:hypothetical protein
VKPYLHRDSVMSMLRQRGIERHASTTWACARELWRWLRPRRAKASSPAAQQMPDRFADWEAREQALRDHLGKDVSILRDRTGGERRSAHA